MSRRADVKTTGRDRPVVEVQALKQMFGHILYELPPTDFISEAAPKEQELEEQLNELSELKVEDSNLP